MNIRKSPLISLSMIVKNEEKYLKQCLDSVKDIVDEIVIVDTGSTDSTLKIANEYGASLYQFEWINDFSAARNYALSKSKGEWILYLDADERITNESGKIIHDTIEKLNQPALLGLRCLVNSIDEKNGKPKLMRYTRLFNNSPEIRFHGKVHEQIEDSLISCGYSIVDTDIEIIHVGYNIHLGGIKEKASRNLELLLDEYKENKSSYYAFHLGNTYEILENYENAFRFFNIALEDKNLNVAYRSICYLNIADYYSSELFDTNLAEKTITDGLIYDPQNPLLNLLAAQINFKSGNIDKAIAFCKDSFVNNEKLKNTKKSNSILDIYIEPDKIYSYGLYLSLANQKINEFDFFFTRSDQSYQNLISLLLDEKPLLRSDFSRIASFINKDNLNLFLLLIENRKDKLAALEILCAVKTKFNDNAKFLIALGNLYYQNGNSDQGINCLKQSLELKQKDPSAVFYLISILLLQNQLSEIPEWLSFAEKQFGHIPVFKEKFQILLQKLGAII
ncbi:MAG: glycosyltransferase [Bacteroidota bacterium]|nr:glycosyltransferase [Bacteroidota bacterium]MDP4195512.1 glycosyltransferase [Bacteroidota bacterium]